MPAAPVAIIDLGSNSIKLLVATRAEDGGVRALHTRALDVRISAGLSHREPRLGEEGMARGLEAVRTLLAEAAAFAPRRTILVATSAVRDAGNGPDFCARLHAATGQAVRVLTGEEEAGLIGRGLMCDASLRQCEDFYVFDLGGGSLECLAFRARRIQQAVSVRLGCVRLTEKFVTDPSAPFPAEASRQIAAHTQDVLERHKVAFTLPAGAVAVGTGGSVTTVRAILGARAGIGFERTEPVVSVTQLRDLLAWVGALPLAERKKIPGLPSARADVFPAALATLLALAELGGLTAFRHSQCNLRHGLADEILAVADPGAQR